MKQDEGPEDLRNLDPTTLANEFGVASELDRLKQIAISLSKPGATAKAAKVQIFLDRFDALIDQARRDTGDDQLRALALVGRLSQQAKLLAGRASTALSEPIRPPQSNAHVLSDPLDRAYLARIVRSAKFDNKDEFLALFIASEPPMKTDARPLAMVALLESVPRLSIALSLMDKHLRARRFETQDPATSLSRLFIRTLECMPDAIHSVNPSVDPDVGLVYAKFLSTALGTHGQPEWSAQVELARNALDVLVAIVRRHFSLVRQPDTFQAVRIVRRLFHPAQWPKETKPVLEAIGELLLEAIALLAQSGITDSRLRELLVVVSDEQRASALLRRLATETSNINNEVRHWLETGRAVEKIASASSVSETLLETVDREIARVLREAEMIAGMTAGVELQLLASISPADAQASNRLREFLARVESLVTDCEMIARARRMETRYRVGDVVEYAPAEHDPDRPISGSRMVRVRYPQVIRKEEGRVPRVVLKATVTPEGGYHGEEDC